MENVIERARIIELAKKYLREYITIEFIEDHDGDIDDMYYTFVQSTMKAGTLTEDENDRPYILQEAGYEFLDTEFEIVIKELQNDVQ